MKFIKQALCCAAMFVCSASSWSATVTTTVTGYGVYGNGRVFVNVVDTINESACPANRIHLSPTHTQVKQVLSLASMAMATGKQVTILTKGCYGTSPTLDTATTSYFWVVN